MLNAIIIEDERLALQELINNLREVLPDIGISATLGSVKESIEYLSTAPKADIIFSDVQLADGLSFEIFNYTDVEIPVIFITAYDEFIMNAFEHNGIDYLLKPVRKEDLLKAILKYKMLEKHFSTSNKKIDNLLTHISNKKKTRLLVRKGLENISLRLDEIALFYTENKIVYVTDNSGKKYLADKNLTDLEEELDDTMFFRANRQYIVNINYVKGFKAYEKVKLVVELSIPELTHCIIISQETAPAFRKWMYEA
ncbi:MAG: response regulator transcription factor [Chitinophagaceae bacterium]|nr:response regulator transcription factor [Chitinophagaceae bacterium]